jgi:AraC-like DNA-binding protein
MPKRLLDLQCREAQRPDDLDQMKLRLLANLAQEFRTRLTLILNGLDRIHLQESDRPQGVFVRRNTERLLRLVEESLNMRDLNQEDLLLQTSEAGLDAQFLRRATDLSDEHMADLEFDVETMARKLAVSRRQLFRKFRAAAGCTPNVFIRALRLKRAAQLLRDSQMTVTEITHAVGFSDLKYFRDIFREQYGVLPGEYARRSKTP